MRKLLLPRRAPGVFLVLCWSLFFFAGCHKKPRFAALDVTAPALKSVFVSSVTNKSAIINWNTNENCTALLEYGTSSDYDRTVRMNIAGSAGSFFITDLVENTLYHFRVTLTDDADNVAVSADGTFTTSGPLSKIVLTPSTLSLFIEESAQFFAAGVDTAGKAVEINPTWSLTDISYGFLSQTVGLYTTFTANLNKGTVTLTATDGAVSAAVDIIITGGQYAEPPHNGEIFMATSASSSNLFVEYEIGLNTSAGKTDWLNENKSDWTDSHDYLKMAYPGDPSWGAVFIVVAPMKPWIKYTERTAFDYRTYSKIQLEIKGEKGTEKVKVGLKDINDADDGAEVKYLISDLEKDWKIYEIPLSTFPSGNRAVLKQIYIPIEFVWDNDPANGLSALKPSTVYVRNIKYIK